MKAAKRRGRGEGSIEVLPSGKYRAVVSSIDKLTGKRLKTSATFDTKDEAVSYRNKLLEEKKDTASGGKTVGKWLDEWLEVKQGKIADGSWKWYSQQARLYIKPIIADLPLAKLDIILCDRFLAEMRGRGISANSQRAALTTLNVALNHAVRYGYIKHNPIKAIQKPRKPHRDAKWWTAEEARQFLASPLVQKHRWYAMWRLALDSGMRQGELLALTWENIEWEKRTIRVQRSLEEVDKVMKVKETKTKKGNRRIIVSEATMDALRAHKHKMEAEDAAYVAAGATIFVSRAGTPIWKNVYRTVFKRLVKKADVTPIRPYDLRHSCASILLTNGASIRAVADRLGHEDVSMTLKHYAHCLPGEQSTLADMTGQLLSAGVSPTNVPQKEETETQPHAA
jgi:integrase